MADRVAIIAGLGNPGPQYRKNRHNVGFMVLDALAEQLGASLSSEKWEAQYGKTRYRAPSGETIDVALLKPLTFMNLSGKAVCQAVRFFKAAPESLLVLHDEIEIPFGDVRRKNGGGHRGQNGLRDIILRCGSPDFHRLCVGVGRPEHRDVAGHVLSDFTKEEQEQLPAIIDKARDLALAWLASFAETAAR